MEIFGLKTQNYNSELILAYRMSKDGLNNKKMWRKCQNYSEIMIFIKTKTNNIIGVYLP